MIYPTPPGELMFALAVNVDDLRPWEFWQMDTEEYALIRDLRGAWFGERAAEKRSINRDQSENE